ncbi:MAG: transporter [Lentisphaerae bacterium]|nr:transporter [Lentisphaerota bacterium]
MNTKIAYTLSMLLVTAGASAHAGRPLAIDDADPVDRGQFEFEAGGVYEHDSDCKHWDFPFGLTYGAFRGAEIGIGFGGQFEERTERFAERGEEECVREHSLCDLVVGAKWQFLESCPLGARHAIAPSVKFPTADDEKELGSGKTDYDVTWIASRSIGEKAGVHLNVGYSWIGGSDDDILHYGMAVDYQVLETVQWVGEVFAEQETSSGADTVVQYNTGFRWNPAENLTLDIAGGSKISGDAPDFTATVGMTWAFGLGSNEMKGAN